MVEKGAITADTQGDDPPRSESRVGQVIAGKYQLVRLLGEGGMGAVYEAQHLVIQRRFAIKFVHADLVQKGEIISRFRREAQSAGSLENENIAAITDVGTADDGAPYLVMEFLAGRDLASILAAHGPLPVPRATHLVIQACRGLEAAHTRGIIHRDLKPENLFVCRRGDGGDLVKVLDFGIAKLRDGDGTTATQTGSAIGTPYYMSREQARGAKELDHRSDIYSLGVILYELLTCEKPHPGEGYNQILFHILTATPTPLATLRPGLPEGLVAAVEKAMAPEPADRFASAMELAQALGPFVGRAITPHSLQEDPPVHSTNAATMATPVSLTEGAGMSGAVSRHPGPDSSTTSLGGIASTDGALSAPESRAALAAPIPSKRRLVAGLGAGLLAALVAGGWAVTRPPEVSRGGVGLVVSAHPGATASEPTSAVSGALSAGSPVGSPAGSPVGSPAGSLAASPVPPPGASVEGLRTTNNGNKAATLAPTGRVPKLQTQKPDLYAP